MKYEEPADPDTSTLPKLPEGWAWGSLEQIGFTGTGATPLRSKEDYYSGGTIPWITSGSLNNPLIIEADEYITELALQETNTKVYPIGTLLVAMYGEGKTRGKVSELAIDAATNQAIAAISILEGHRYLIEYVKIFLQYNYNNIRRLSAGGVQPNLNLSIVKNTQIPLPPRDEQEEIEKKVQEILLTTSKAEDSMNIQLTKITRLRQSVLQRAFCGQLIN
jgi:type I restriction enzyme S subunit